MKHAFEKRSQSTSEDSKADELKCTKRKQKARVIFVFVLISFFLNPLDECMELERMSIYISSHVIGVLQKP